MNEKPIKIKARQQRKWTLTPLGHQAVKWIKAHERRGDEFAYFCPGCLRVLASCSCPVEDR